MNVQLTLLSWLTYISLNNYAFLENIIETLKDAFKNTNLIPEKQCTGAQLVSLSLSSFTSCAVVLLCSTTHQLFPPHRWGSLRIRDMDKPRIYIIHFLKEDFSRYNKKWVSVSASRLWQSGNRLFLHSYLKCMGRVVHTVDPEGEAQRVAGIRTTKHGQPQPLGCLLVQRLPHQRVAARMLQQHVAPLGLQQTVAGRALLVHWHHFLWRGGDRRDSVQVH